MKRNTDATISAGLALFIWLPLLNFLIGISAIFFGVRALQAIRATPQKGKILALAGMFFGIMPYYFFGYSIMERMFGLSGQVEEIFIALYLPVVVVLGFIILKRTKLI